MSSKLHRLPNKDDKLVHVESKTVFIVVKRISENRLIARREDGLEAMNGAHPYGYPRDHMLINEVLWLIRHGIFNFEDKS